MSFDSLIPIDSKFQLAKIMKLVTLKVKEGGLSPNLCTCTIHCGCQKKKQCHYTRNFTKTIPNLPKQYQNTKTPRIIQLSDINFPQPAIKYNDRTGEGQFQHPSLNLHTQPEFKHERTNVPLRGEFRTP